MFRYPRSHTLALAVACVAVGLAGFRAPAGDAAGRGLLDSVVETLVGGNPGDGSANARTAPLPNLTGGIARDTAGGIYLTEDGRILKLTSAGALSVIAGAKGVAAYRGDGGLAVNAVFSAPTLLAADAAGNLYVLDSGNNRIRKITAADGKIATVAGNGNTNGGAISDVGRLAADARLNGAGIVGLTVDSAGNIYYADGGSQVIYRVDAAAGVLSIAAGNGLTGASLNGALAYGNPLNGIRGLAALGTDLIYTETGAVRRINLSSDSLNVVIAGALDAAGNVVQNRPPHFPDGGARAALQVDPAAPAQAPAGGVPDPQQVAVDGTTVVFWDNTVGRIRSFIPGGAVQTVFGEVSEPTLGTGFRGDSSPAATDTPRAGIVVRPGLNGFLDALSFAPFIPGGDDLVRWDAGLQQFVIESGPNGIAETTAFGLDVQVAAAGSTSTNDYTRRNDDPRANLGPRGGLVAAGGVVTFADVGNRIVRQFAIGGNVTTVAGCFQPYRFENTGNAAPVITSRSSVTGQQGVAFTYSIAATNAPASYNIVWAGAAPAGLAINVADGTIAGTPTSNGVFKANLTASNAQGDGVATLTLNISPVAGAPAVTSALVATAVEGQPFSYAITATNTPTVYAAAVLPAALGINVVTGAISGTPNIGAAGAFPVTISATNAAGTGNAVLVLDVVRAPTAPLVTSALTAAGTQGQAFSYNIAATNPPITFYGAAGLPAGLGVNNVTGAITGTPLANGVYNVTIQAQNAAGTDRRNLRLAIAPPPGAPVITSATLTTGYASRPFAYVIVASNSPTSYSAIGLPFWAVLNAATGVISSTAPLTTGTWDIDISATNAAGTANSILTIVISPLPPPPVAGGNAGFAQRLSDNAPVGAKGAPIRGPRSLAKDSAGNIFFDALDAFGQRKIYKYDAAAKTVSVVAGQVYVNGVVTKAGEGGPARNAALTGLGAQAGLASDDSVFIADTVPGSAPVLSSHTVARVDATGNVTTVAGIPYLSGSSFPDGDRSTLAPDGNPDPLLKREGRQATAVMLNAPEGVLAAGAADFVVADTGNSSVLVVAGGTVSHDISLPGFAPSFLARASATSILAASRTGGAGVPVLYSAATAAGQQGVPFAYTILATDSPSGYGAAPLPAGLSRAGNVISGTPTTNGTFVVTLSATNGAGTGSLALTLAIAPGAGMPVISSALNATATEGVPFAYNITATGVPTSYNAAGHPGSLLINPVTGALTGTPAVGEAGRIFITISATNATGTGNARLTLDIDTALGLPVITSPVPMPAGSVGVAYNYTIAATNSPLSFGATNLPPGLTLNSGTGVISGTPTQAGNIVVTLTATTAAGSANTPANLAINAGGGLRRIDLAGPAPAVTPLGPGFSGVKGIALGTNGVFVADSTGVTLLDPGTGAPKYVARNPGLDRFAIPPEDITGLFVSGTTVRFATTFGVIREFTDNGTSPPAAAGITTKAGRFFMPAGLIGAGGPNLQTAFQFTALTPLAAFANGDQLVGDDGVLQYRRVVYGAVPPDATATVVAGSGNDCGVSGDGGPATSAAIGVGGVGTVGGIAVASDGTVYFSDAGLSVVRRVKTDGTIETAVGIPGRNGYGGDGLDAKVALLNNPGGLAFCPPGALLINDTGNQLVRKLQSDNKVVNVAGAPGEAAYAGDQLAGAAARFNSPRGCAFDANRDFYIADTGNAVLRMLSSKGIVQTVAGNGNGRDVSQQETAALEAALGDVLAVTVDTGGKSYTVSGGAPHTLIRTASGLSRAVAGMGNAAGFNGDGLPGLQTLLNSPGGVLFEANLGLVFTDTGNDRVRRLVNLAETTNTPPQAVIVVTPDTLGAPPFSVHLDGTQSVDANGDIVSYEWTLGDGTSATGPVVDHVYAAGGAYTVTLAVTDTQGQASSATTTVFVAQAIIGSSTSGKGAFKVAFGPKARGKDSFSLAMKNVNNLSAQAGKSAKIYIASFSIDATVGGKGVKSTSKNVKLTINADPKKKTVALAVKGVSLAAALAEAGVKNENTVAPGKTALIPVVIVVNNGALVIGDKFLFVYKGKYNSGASGKFSQ